MNPIEKFLQLRQESELSQAKFAKKLGVSKDVIGNIESGRQKTISVELATALEKEYHIPFRWWLTGQGSMELYGEQLVDKICADIDEETKETIELAIKANKGDLHALELLEQRLKGLKTALKNINKQ